MSSAFAAAIVALLVSQGSSQQALADRLGVTRAAVNDWCRGRSIPAPETVFAIEAALELPPGDLSRTLGYLPLSVLPEGTVPTVAEAIASDPALDDRARYLLLSLYQALTDPHGVAPHRRVSPGGR
jgi:transcriptional regulator with XRE-family HTH domain